LFVFLCFAPTVRHVRNPVGVMPQSWGPAD